MSGKRNISYVKPQDPSFLVKLKAQIGFKEAPTVETKRQKLDSDNNSSDSEGCPDREEEKPQIVVLQKGDLTVEEVLEEETRIAREAAEARSDLSRPIVFQRRKENTNHTSTSTYISSRSTNSSSKGTRSNKLEVTTNINKEKLKSTKNKRKIHKSTLSFNIDEEDEELL